MLLGIIALLSLCKISLLSLPYNWLFFVGLILFFDSISSRLLILLRLLEKPWYYLIVGFINIVSSLLFNIVFIHGYLLGDKGALYALVGTSIVQFLWLLPILYKYVDFHVYDISLSKKMFLFGIPFLPAAILFVITGMVDRFFIKHYLDLTQVGIYGAGYKIASIVSIVVLAFNLNWQPYYLKHYNDSSFIKNVEDISKVFSIILIYISTFISVWCGLLIKIKFFDFYIIGIDFWSATAVIPWIAFGYFFYGLFVLQMPTIYICNKQMWSPIFWGSGALINVIFNVILIPSLGIVGAGISTLISYATMSMLLIYKNQSWLPLNFINKFLFSYFVLSVSFVFIFNNIDLNRMFFIGWFVIYTIISGVYLLNNKPVLEK